jgi:hypothetical protein
MSAATPLTTRKLRVDDAAGLIEESGVDMAELHTQHAKITNPVQFNRPKKSGPKCDDTISFWTQIETETWYQKAPGELCISDFLSQRTASKAVTPNLMGSSQGSAQSAQMAKEAES